MNIAFRADASLNIGTGHVMRCLTLADALREQSAECHFICREHEGHLMDHIKSCGYVVHALPKPYSKIAFESDLAHASWLGANWSSDAQQTQRFIADLKLDWLILDHYALDCRWELALRSSCKRMMVVDDLADRQHDCDLLLDQNYGSSAQRYAGLVPAACTQLHGPEFALIKPIYVQRREQQRVRSGKIERVLIYFGGGADLINLTGMTLCAFQVSELAGIELDIVIGSSYANKEELEAAAASRVSTSIHLRLPDLSELMARADIAIGAGGATTWERCCLGLPSVVISIADNQRPACEAMVGDGLLQYIGHVGDVSSELIREQVFKLMSEPELLRELSTKSMKLVDGNGINRILDEITLNL